MSPFEERADLTGSFHIRSPSMLNPPRRVGRLKHGKDVRLLDVFVRRSGLVPRAVGLRLRVDRTRIAD